MFIGYADDHDGDLYRICNPKMERIHITRDVIWMKHMMFTKVVEDPVIEVNNDNIEDGQGDEENPVDPGEVEDNGTDDESEYDSSDEEPVEEDKPWSDVTTRSGRSVRAPSRLIVAVGASALGLTKAEENYFALLDQGYEAEFDPEELICIGAAPGGGFENTQELHVKKYKDVMKGPDKQKWENVVFQEHERMVENQVWRAVPKKDVSRNSKVMPSTWAMNKKLNGIYRARLSARGYEQADGIHYDSSNISSPVTNDATIRIIMVLMIISKWTVQLVDVKGAFLCGNFKDGEEIFIEVLEGFEEFYGAYVLLLLMQKNMD
jgi:hypothetical protein